MTSSCWNSDPVHICHDDVIKWKHFPRNWPFVRGIHRSPVNSPHKGQWRGALMFSLIFVWINDHEAGDLRRYRSHYDVIVMTGCGTCTWTALSWDKWRITTLGFILKLGTERFCDLMRHLKTTSSVQNVIRNNNCPKMGIKGTKEQYLTINGFTWPQWAVWRRHVKYFKTATRSTTSQILICVFFRWNTCVINRLIGPWEIGMKL